jgi:competence protein ComEA
MFYLSRAEKVALLVLLALLLSGASSLAYLKLQRSAESADDKPIFVPAPSARSDCQIVVNIVGAVNRPGVYALPGGARLADAIARAGGATARADLTALDLSIPVREGTKVLVPYVVEGLTSGGDVPGSDSEAGLISLNRSKQQELEALPGIGPVYAERIIAYRDRKMREEGQGFQSTDELLNIPGIGPKRYAAVRDLVVP